MTQKIKSEVNKQAKLRLLELQGEVESLENELEREYDLTSKRAVQIQSQLRKYSIEKMRLEQGLEKFNHA